ncbi:hypothetical protein GC194_01480 [bacterium]|nr:hypothetical protein [bacterium]
MRTILCITCLILLCSCQKDNFNFDKAPPKYYVEGSMANGSPFYLRMYKMNAFRYDTTYPYAPNSYIVRGQRFDEPVYVKLESNHGQHMDSLIRDFPEYWNTWNTGNKFVGKCNTHYRFTTIIGTDTLQALFYIPDTMAVDTYYMDTMPGQYSLTFHVKIPQSYLKHNIQIGPPMYFSVNGMDDYEYCPNEYTHSASDVAQTGLLDWYSIQGCATKRYFNTGDDSDKLRHFAQLFPPYYGINLWAYTESDYKYSRELMANAISNMKGMNYPSTHPPSKFNSDVFYGGIVGYSYQRVVFKK